MLAEVCRQRFAAMAPADVEDGSGGAHPLPDPARRRVVLVLDDEDRAHSTEISRSSSNWDTCRR